MPGAIDNLKKLTFAELSDGLDKVASAVSDKHSKMKVESLKDHRRIPLEFLLKVRDTLLTSGLPLEAQADIQRGANMLILEMIRVIEYKNAKAETIKPGLIFEGSRLFMKLCKHTGFTVQSQEVFDANANNFQVALEAFQSFFRAHMFDGEVLKSQSIFSVVEGFYETGAADQYWNLTAKFIADNKEKIAHQERAASVSAWEKAKPVEPSYIDRFLGRAPVASSSNQPSAAPAPGGPSSSSSSFSL